MSAVTLKIPAGDHDQVRVIAIDTSSGAPPDAEALAAMLGAPLDLEHVDIVNLRDIAELGLAAYLEEGHGVDPAALAGDRARLDALRGHVAVIRSAAFGGRPATLTIAAPLRWIGSYPEAGADTGFVALPDADASADLPPHAAPVFAEEEEGETGEELAQRRRRRRLAVAVLLLVGLLVVLSRVIR